MNGYPHVQTQFVRNEMKQQWTAAEALGYLQKCPEFSLPRAVATRAVGALGQPLWSFFTVPKNGKHHGKDT